MHWLVFLTSTYTSTCDRGELVPHEEDGILLCNNASCGACVKNAIDSERPTFKDTPAEAMSTLYIRLNHFKEILSQFQAKETTQIDKDVMKLIRDRIVRQRIPFEKLTYETTREILKTLGLTKYFEHVRYINSKFGVQPPTMDAELVKVLCDMFLETEYPWVLYCPPSRINFFNYTYILYQLLVLLDQRQFLPFLTLLKDRDKQLEQDIVWEKVCNYNNWVFFPTV